MLHRPAVLLLDEPTVGLDPTARHAVWERLRELVAAANPLTYLVDALRTAMVHGGGAGLPSLATDAGVLAGALIVLVAIASRLCPTVIR